MIRGINSASLDYLNWLQQLNSLSPSSSTSSTSSMNNLFSNLFTAANGSSESGPNALEQQTEAQLTNSVMSSQYDSGTGTTTTTADVLQPEIASDLATLVQDMEGTIDDATNASDISGAGQQSGISEAGSSIMDAIGKYTAFAQPNQGGLSTSQLSMAV